MCDCVNIVFIAFGHYVQRNVHTDCDNTFETNEFLQCNRNAANSWLNFQFHTGTCRMRQPNILNTNWNRFAKTTTNVLKKLI